LTLYCFAQRRSRSHAPTIDFVFARFSGVSFSSPGSNGCVLNHAPFFADELDGGFVGEVAVLDR
jgi:hypothetical protein